MRNSKYGTLYDLFGNVHDGTVKPSEIFEKIEGRKFKDSDISGNVIGISNSKDIFFGRYIIAVVKDCTNYKDCDVLLAIYGLLEGYSELEISERREKYCQNVGIYNKKQEKDLPLNIYWTNPQNSQIHREETALKHLVKTLGRKI